MEKSIHMKFVLPALMALWVGGGMLLAKEVVNPENPLKGTYRFPLEEVWRTYTAGENPFGMVADIDITDSGHVGLRDLKNREYYAFDENGKFLAAFGSQGEGPGQVKNIGGADLTAVGNTLVIEDPDRFHYFTDRGEYTTSRRKTAGANLFINLDEYISAPVTIAGLPSEEAQMRYINLKTGEDRVIADFTVFDSGVLRTDRGTANLVVPSITPMMVFGRYQDRIYYGMNHQYKIYITDIQATPHGSFTLQRKGNPVTLKEREDVLIRLAKGFAPKELAIAMAKTLRDEVTCFSNIDTYDDLLYIFQSHFVPTHIQEMDIVSPEGEFLYRGIFKIEEGSVLLAGPFFAGGYAWLAGEDEEGEGFVAKYKTEMPK